MLSGGIIWGRVYHRGLLTERTRLAHNGSNTDHRTAGKITHRAHPACGAPGTHRGFLAPLSQHRIIPHRIVPGSFLPRHQ